MANKISLNPTSYHGAGAINEIATEIKAHGFKKAFVASDPDLVKFGVTGKVTDILDKENIPWELYSNIKPNPTIENVQTGVEAFKNSGADVIVAIGGGSSMDTSKAIGIIITNPEFEDVRSLEGVAPTKNKCVPIIAVPTTAGTASEVTINYVITDEERKAYTLAHNKLTMNTDFDFEILESELEEISDINMSEFGFDLSIEELEPEVEEDDFEVELPEEPKAKLGDIYQLGNHRLMCGDSTSEEDVSKFIP